MTKTTIIDIGIGYVSILENYLIMELNPGINVTSKDNDILVDLTETFYKDKDVVYITNRKNSYSVNPAVYFETSKIKNVIGFAVVSQNGMSTSNAEIEKLFFNKPFEIFSNLDDAIQWANDLCESNKKD